MKKKKLVLAPKLMSILFAILTNAFWNSLAYTAISAAYTIYTVSLCMYFQYSIPQCRIYISNGRNKEPFDLNVS